MMEVAMAYMPTLDMPCKVCSGIEDYDVGDRIKGILTYEVVAKDETGVTIKVKSLSLDAKKRLI